MTDPLSDTTWEGWKRQTLTADASARRYERLGSPNGDTAIAVHVPKSHEDYAVFLRIAKYLGQSGLSVPKLLFRHPNEETFVITDLGTNLVADILASSPAEATSIHEAVLELILHLRKVEIPDIPIMTHPTAINMLDPLLKHMEPTGAVAIRTSMTRLLTDHVGGEKTLSLRDLHAENLVWRPNLTGLSRLGVLDFQDAMRAPEGYDLASYTRDVRRDIPEETAAHLVENFATQIGVELDTFNRQVSAIAIQRNLRILGIFRDLIASGQTKYRSFGPQVWSYLDRDLAEESFGEVRKILEEHLPRNLLS